jgi:hypothetical protein
MLSDAGLNKLHLLIVLFYIAQKLGMFNEQLRIKSAIVFKVGLIEGKHCFENLPMSSIY